MPVLNWSENYSVKITELDNQNKQAFNLVNQLCDSVQGAKGKDILKKQITDFANHIRGLFAAEEKFLTAAEFPDLSSHKIAHDDFTNKVMELKTQCDQGNATVTMDFINYAKDWLERHITRSDKKFVLYLSGRGVL